MFAPNSVKLGFDLLIFARYLQSCFFPFESNIWGEEIIEFFLRFFLEENFRIIFSRIIWIFILILENFSLEREGEVCSVFLKLNYSIFRWKFSKKIEQKRNFSDPRKIFVIFPRRFPPSCFLLKETVSRNFFEDFFFFFLLYLRNHRAMKKIIFEEKILFTRVSNPGSTE